MPDLVINISTASDCSGEQVVVESSSTVTVGRGTMHIETVGVRTVGILRSGTFDVLESISRER